MNEPDLHRLPMDMPDRLAVACRPVDDIIARGTARRRRRRTLRAAGLTSAAVALVAVGTLATADRPDVVSDDPPASQPSSQPTGPPAPSPTGMLPTPGTCEEGDDAEPLDPGQVDPRLRVLPTWLPDGHRLADLQATRSHGYWCSYGQPMLVVAAFEGDTMTATMSVTGPYPAPQSIAGEPTPIRGTTGSRWEGTRDTAGLHLEWTEPGGGWWTVNGRGVDEPTLRALVEALVLSTVPGSPPAVLPTDALPDGYEVVWQAPQVPDLSGDDVNDTWIVGFGVDGTAACSIGLSEMVGETPVVAWWAEPGATRTPVRGGAGLVPPGGMGEGEPTLRWGEPTSPGVVGTLGCNLDLATARRIVESLEPVGPDDPRLDELAGDAD